MTEKVNPSTNRPAEAFKTAGAIAYAGGEKKGFIVDSSETTKLSVKDSGITDSNLNAFDYTTNGLDVTVDGGEAFIFGSWLVKDTQTTVSLADNTSGQTVYVGWNKNGTNDVIVGLSKSTDNKLPIATFDTNSGSIVGSTDKREIGQGDGEASTLISSDGTPIEVNNADLDLNGNDLQDITQTIWDSSSGEILDSAIGSIQNSTLANSNFTVAGNDVSLGDSTSVNHSDLSGIGSDDHHTKYTDSDAISAVGASTSFANSDLSNSSVKVAGNSVSLGGSTAVNHSDLSNISGDDHHTRYSDEEAQDSVGGITVGGVDIDTNYDDSNNTLTVSHSDTSTQGNVSASSGDAVTDVNLDGNGHVTSLSTTSISHDNLDGISSSDHHTRYSDEEAQDATNSLLSSGNNISLVYDDSSNNLVINGPSQYTDEEAQDAVGAILTGGTDIDTNYDDGNDTLTVSHSDTSSQANVSAAAGDAVTDVDLDERGHITSLSTSSINHDNIDGVSSSDHHTRYSDEEAKDAVGGIASGGTDIEVNYDDASDSLNILHSDTSSQENVSTGAGAAITDVNLDGRGHVTSLSTTTINHDNINGVSSDDHHTKYTDSDATSAVGASTPFANSDLSNSSVTVAGNSVSLGGSTSVNHNDLSNISSNDHHSKTSSASELTDVSPDSTSDAHHTKYTDSDARSAVGASTPFANSDLSNDSITISSGTGISGGGSVSLGQSLAINVDAADDEEIGFGSGDDMTIRYDSGSDDIRFQDNRNNTDRMAIDRNTGNISIDGELTEGTSL